MVLLKVDGVPLLSTDITMEISGTGKSWWNSRCYPLILTMEISGTVKS